MAIPLYDVALSFAGEQRDYVRSVAARLRESDVRYFFDEDNEVDLWGRNLVDVLDRTYRHSARFVVMFVSAAYAEKVWPNLERQSAQSRAITEMEDPYVLPVRFDDTDLPGLPPSVFYKDARESEPDALAELIEAKVAQSRERDNAEDRGDGWEYLLLISELASAMAGYDREWRDFELGVAYPDGEAISLEDVPADLQTRSRAAVRIVENVNRLFSDEAMERAVGRPGEEGDPDGIRHLARSIIDVYAALLDWAARVRGALPPDEALPVYRTLSDYVALPLQQMRDFVAELDEGIRPVIQDVRAGNVPDKPVELTFTLTVSIDPAAEARFSEELDKLSRFL